MTRGDGPQRRFGRWTLVDCIGSGATSTVWSARRPDAPDEPLRALKIVPGDDEGLRLVANEARAAAAVQHAGIVGVLEIVHDGGRIGLVAELLLGSLADWLRQRGPLPPWWIARVGLDVLDGLSAAHRAGLLHRDLKPANLLVDRDARVRIADFGIAKLLAPGTAATLSSAVWGTLPFVAPERRYGKPEDARADLYALAATLACLAVGTPIGELFVPAVRERLQRSLPAALVEVLARGGAYAPDDRFDDAAAMAAALAGLLDALPGRDDIDLSELRAAARLDTHVGGTQPQPRAPARASLRGVLATGAALALGLGLGTVLQPQARHIGATEVPRCEGSPADVRMLTRMGPRETSDGLITDLDRDGHEDLLFVNQLDESLSIYWGSDAAPLGTPQELAIGRSPVRPAVGDLDGDGHTDLLIAQSDASQLLVLRGRGARRFEAMPLLFQAPQPGRIALLDWDGDGALDLLMQTRGDDQCTAWRRGRGDGGFEPYACLGPFTDLVQPFGTSPPAVFRRTDDDHLVRHRPGAGGALGPSEPLADLAALGAPKTAYVIVADADRDGLDEVYAWALGRTVPALLRLAGAGAPCELWHQPVFQASQLVDVADVDGDGLLDAMARASCSGCASNHQVAFGVPR